MAISLPTSPRCMAPSTPYLRRFGGVLSPFLGGPEQLINRLGTRWGQRVVFPPMRSAEEGRLFVSRLVQAGESSLLMRWEGEEVDKGDCGAPQISAAVSGGSIIPISGLPAGKLLKEGWFFSIIHGGRRYVHMFTADALANAAGAIASATIFPMLRVPLTAGDVLEIELPMIEGLVQSGEELNWEMAIARRTNISFTMVEAA